jgi:hypothetical protein
VSSVLVNRLFLSKVITPARRVIVTAKPPPPPPGSIDSVMMRPSRASSNPPKVMLDACVLLYDSCLKHQASHLNNTHLEVVTGSLTDTDIHALTGAA